MAAIASPEQIAKEFKNVYIESHKHHISNGYFESASAALRLAAGINEGMKSQEKTFQRRTELIYAVVLGRRSNKERSLA